ncbi:S-Ena type endospore appendage [Sutcliffiella horikoshii]|uniref:S-Ena type endospore appendage n=1 Tax=Sutcliffiella horikoshii TaxID=79883 RepID=UPI00384A7D91
MKPDNQHCIQMEQVHDWVQLPFSIDVLRASHTPSSENISSKVSGVYQLQGTTEEILWKCPRDLNISGTFTIHCTENTDAISVIINDKRSFSITGNSSRSFTFYQIKKVAIEGLTASTFSSGKYELTLHFQSPTIQALLSSCFISDKNGKPSSLLCLTTSASTNQKHIKKASILLRGFVTIFIQRNEEFIPLTLPIQYKTTVNMYVPEDAYIHTEIAKVKVDPVIIPSCPEDALSYLYINITGKVDIETIIKTTRIIPGTIINKPR